MAIKIEDRCKKLYLPNYKVVDIMLDVFGQIQKFLQIKTNTPESAGYILGYQHKETKNVVLERVTLPQKDDMASRYKVKILSGLHQIIINNAKREKSYYMGVWHTHPQKVPEPSETDWNDWYKTLETDKTGCGYAFFIIAGTEEFRIWTGDFGTKEIIEIYECEKVGGIYKKF